MWLLLIIVALWSGIGAIMWVKMKTIVWWEWLIATVVGAGVVLGVYFIAITGLTRDIETWSGRVHTAVYMPKWTSEHQRAVYRTEYYTDSKGNTCSRQVFSHYETYYNNHGPDWWVNTSLGRYGIDKGKYDYLSKKYGGEIRKERGSRPSYHSGDKNDYHTVNKTGWLEPVATTKSWENRVKAAPSVFSFGDVPEDAPVHEWPKVNNPFVTGRLIGSMDVSRLKFDQMNARLGPTKKVNVIMINFGQKDSSVAHQQEAKWIGGKKNDLVLCFGDGNADGKAEWSYVFGWTERELVKRNLETILLLNPVNNDLLPLIEQEVIANYELRDWSQFEYLSIEVPWWTYFVGILALAISQTVCYLFAHHNQIDEKDPNDRGRPFRPYFLR